MLSNHEPWQPGLTNHSASVKIKVTTGDLTRGWENSTIILATVQIKETVNFA